MLSCSFEFDYCKEGLLLFQKEEVLSLEDVLPYKIIFFSYNQTYFGGEGGACVLETCCLKEEE